MYPPGIWVKVITVQVLGEYLIVGYLDPPGKLNPHSIPKLKIFIHLPHACT